ncbi:MAG: branched-chain amino acid ABC transporter permease, partial [Alcaligenaceae bacterium]|nr:branched-chain amino acid ABC transporter permease [Alcaligenaceae bacterium]
MRSLLNALIAIVAGWLIMTLTTSPALLGTFTQAVIHALFALGVGFLLKQNG